MRTQQKYHGPCPCGSRRAYAKCCQRWHDVEAAPDAESLMRSRYTAYVFELEDYILATWHPRTRPALLDPAAARGRWLGLKVVRHEAVTADSAAVEFIARYKSGGQVREMHEISRFVFEDGRWLYVDGEAG
jgi:SEC-C motif-containing protein